MAHDLVERVGELSRQLERPPRQELDVLQHRRAAHVPCNSLANLEDNLRLGLYLNDL